MVLIVRGIEVVLEHASQGALIVAYMTSRPCGCCYRKSKQGHRSYSDGIGQNRCCLILREGLLDVLTSPLPHLDSYHTYLHEDMIPTAPGFIMTQSRARGSHL